MIIETLDALRHLVQLHQELVIRAFAGFVLVRFIIEFILRSSVDLF